MGKIDFVKAYFIKLGEKGLWEKSSIEEAKIRIGYDHQTLDDINKQKWVVIRKKLSQISSNESTLTKDLNDLKTLFQSTKDDIWITFYSSRLWWCRVGAPKIFQDKTSKYRKVDDSWHDSDVDGNTLYINRISGKISKTQGYRGTRCTIHEIDELKRILNNTPSVEYNDILEAKTTLIKAIQKGLKQLHWKDFETLIDLVFRHAGWRRISVVGETMKYVDLELEEPITGDLYQVQIKSSASLQDFNSYKKDFSKKNFRKLYFVVHSPERSLENYNSDSLKDVELLLSHRLSEMIADAGLSNWLMNKIK